MSSIFFRALAVMDSILLISMLSRYWALAQFGYDIGDANMFMCRFHPYLLYWSRDLSGWILAVIAVERYMGVSRPHWNKIVFTRKRAIGILVGFLFVFALLNISLPISHDMEEIEYEYYDYNYEDYPDTNATESTNVTSMNSVHMYDIIDSSGEEDYYFDDPEPTENKKICCMTKGYDYFNHHVWPFFDLIKQSILPFLIICICNINIIYTVIKAKHMRNREMNSKQNNNNLMGMTVLLISVSVVYLICTLPAAIIYIIKQEVLSEYVKNPMPTHIEAEWHLYKAIAIFFIVTNSAVNFPLYCLSGPKFRKGLKNLFVAEREMRRRSTRSFSRSTNSTNAGSNIYIRQVSTKSDVSLLRQLSSNSNTSALLIRQTSII